MVQGLDMGKVLLLPLLEGPALEDPRDLHQVQIPSMQQAITLTAYRTDRDKDSGTGSHPWMQTDLGRSRRVNSNMHL